MVTLGYFAVCVSFVQAWRFLLQLRWVRRRLDAARHTACKASAACRRLPERDAAERAAVTKAQKAKDMADNGSFGYSGQQLVTYTAPCAPKSLHFLIKFRRLVSHALQPDKDAWWQTHCVLVLLNLPSISSPEVVHLPCSHATPSCLRALCVNVHEYRCCQRHL